MAVEWWRSWHGAPTDAKWLSIARRASVAPGMAVAVAWALFDHASQADERGRVAGLDTEALADFFGWEREHVDAVIRAMTDKGMIEDGRLVAWKRRQPKREDNSNQRVKEHRERQRNTAQRSVTQCNAPEKDTDTDSSSLRSDEPRVDLDREFDQTFWPAYPHKVGRPDALVAFQRARQGKRIKGKPQRKPASLDEIMAGLQRYVAAKPSDHPWMNPSTFLNGERWNDEPAPDSNTGRPSGQRASGHDAFVAAMGDTLGPGGAREAGPPTGPAEPIPPDRQAAGGYPSPCIDVEPGPDGWAMGGDRQGDNDAPTGIPGGPDERGGSEREGGGVSDCAGRSAGMGGREGMPGVAAQREFGRAGQSGLCAEPAAVASLGHATCRAGDGRIPELAVIAGGRGRA